MFPCYSEAVNERLGGGFQGLCEIYGDEGVGKTGLALSLFKKGRGLYFDLDGSFPLHLKHLATEHHVNIVNYADLSVTDLAKACKIASEHVDLIVLDPIGIYGPYDLSKLASELSFITVYSNVTAIVINHCHSNGKPKGDDSMGMYSNIRLEMRDGEKADENGMKTLFRVTKNTYGEAYVGGEIDIDFGMGERQWENHAIAV